MLIAGRMITSPVSACLVSAAIVTLVLTPGVSIYNRVCKFVIQCVLCLEYIACCLRSPVIQYHNCELYVVHVVYRFVVSILYSGCTVEASQLLLAHTLSRVYYNYNYGIVHSLLYVLCSLYYRSAVVQYQDIRAEITISNVETCK